jgi:hypothetical protein
MQFTQLLRMRESAAGAGKIYLKTVDGTEFRGNVKTIGSDFLQVETENGRIYTVLTAHILFAGL